MKEESDPQIDVMIAAFLSMTPEDQERLRNEQPPYPIPRSKYPELMLGSAVKMEPLKKR